MRLPLPGGPGHALRFRDLMGSSSFDREKGDLEACGVYLDMPPWGYHVFEVSEL